MGGGGKYPFCPPPPPPPGYPLSFNKTSYDFVFCAILGSTILRIANELLLHLRLKLSVDNRIGYITLATVSSILLGMTAKQLLSKISLSCSTVCQGGGIPQNGVLTFFVPMCSCMCLQLTFQVVESGCSSTPRYDSFLQ